MIPSTQVETGIPDAIKDQVAGLDDDKVALRLEETYDLKMSLTSKIRETVECL